MSGADSARPRFKRGDAVRVRAVEPPGHTRTPWYIQGKTGAVEKVHGAFRNPESLAYGGDGLPKPCLYLVRFAHADVWKPAGRASRDAILVDVYEHWLEPA